MNLCNTKKNEFMQHKNKVIFFKTYYITKNIYPEIMYVRSIFYVLFTNIYQKIQIENLKLKSC